MATESRSLPDTIQELHRVRRANKRAPSDLLRDAARWMHRLRAENLRLRTLRAKGGE